MSEVCIENIPFYTITKEFSLTLLLLSKKELLKKDVAFFKNPVPVFTQKRAQLGRAKPVTQPLLLKKGLSPL